MITAMKHINRLRFRSGYACIYINASITAIQQNCPDVTRDHQCLRYKILSLLSEKVGGMEAKVV